jgi:predicted XRE-type DNA-binding protein
MAKTRARKRSVKRAAKKPAPKNAGTPSKETIPRKPLAREVLKVIGEKGLSQVAAGAVVGEQQSQISLVSSGRLAGFSPERLIRMLSRLGRDIEIIVRPSGPPARAGRVRIITGRAKKR